MITNGSITYYHKTLDNNKLPIWNRYVFESVWHFGGKGSSINKGYEKANDVDVRIPLANFPNAFISVKALNQKPVYKIDKMQVKDFCKETYEDRKFLNNFFKVGDIISIGENADIEKQSDLNNIEYYNVTSININDFGNNPHIHLGGK